MENNKTGKPASAAGRYLKYAIGEIALVVIGILIALSINNWNEASKKNKLKEGYTLNMLNDLTTDTLQLNANIELNEAIFLKGIDSLLAIIESHTTTAEDIKEIGRTFGLGGLRTQNTYNNNTFNILISTGNIDLFDDVIIQKIMELNRLQNDQLGVAEGNRNIYFNLYNNYISNYVIVLTENESLNNELWNKVDAQKQAPIFLNIIATQRHSVTRYIELTKEVISRTEELMDVLRAQE